MNKIYVFQALMIFVKSTLGIFVPAYLYSLNYSISMIIFYVILISITYLLMIPYSVKIINIIGFKKTIFLSLPVYFLQILSINYISSNSLFYFIAAISFGIYVSLFWPAMHSEIAVNGSLKHRSSQMGNLQILMTIFASISPMIGGFILQEFGYSYLLIMSSFFLFIGALPLYFAKDIKLKNYDFKHRKYLTFLKTKRFSSSKLAFIGEGLEGILNFTIWPVILFILLNSSFLKLGFLFSITSFISIIIILYFKSYLDKHNKNKVLRKSTRILSINWFFRFLAVLFLSFFLYFIEIFFKLISSIFVLSFTSIFYNNAKKKGYMDYIIFRELHLHLTKIFSGFIFIIFLNIFGEGLKTLSFILMFGIIAPLFLSKIKEE